MNWENFDWGDNINESEKNFFKIESTSSYNRIFDVEENDLVVDIGAFVGSFTYSILDKNPQHVFVLEPLKAFFKILYKNLKHNQVSFTNAAISDKDEVEIEWCGVTEKAKAITFESFLENNCIDKIDFLKCDCEGGEYTFFTEKNIDFLKNNVRKMVFEFHLEKEKFRYFRDNILPHFDKFYVFSIDGVDIKWDLYNEHFIDYYKSIIIHFDNRI